MRKVNLALSKWKMYMTNGLNCWLKVTSDQNKSQNW